MSTRKRNKFIAVGNHEHKKKRNKFKAAGNHEHKKKDLKNFSQLSLKSNPLRVTLYINVKFTSQQKVLDFFLWRAMYALIQ